MNFVRLDDPARHLQQMLDDAFRGRGSAAVIGGTMASGKTVLLDAFCRAAADQGAVVLTATASGEEESLRFGVVRQLLRNLPEPLRAATEERIREVERSWDEVGAHPVHGEYGSPDPATVNAAQAFGSELLAQASGPVVLAVDDAQFLDSVSLHCLLAAARRVDQAGMLIVATSCGCPHHRCRGFRSRMGRLSRARQLRLGPLTESEVELALRDRFDARADAELAAECHAVSGGNLALLDALFQDMADADSGVLLAVPGAGFREAVLDCVERCSADRLAVLQMTALMGGAASQEQIAALAGLDRGLAASVIRMLQEAGLLGECGCRHPAIASAVAESMPVRQRRDAHERFAQLLYEDNAPAAMIARQLVAAGLPPLPWAVEAFRMAAEETSRGDVQAAAQYLRAARQLTRDEEERAALTVALAGLAWRTSPGLVRRQLPELLDLLRDGRLDGADIERTLNYLLWFGREDEAAEALAVLLASAPAWDADGIERARRVVLALTVWHPVLVRRVLADHELCFEALTAGGSVSARVVDAGNLYRLLLRNADRRETAVEAQRLVENCRLADGTLDQLCTALLVLAGANEMACAFRWCDALVKEAEAHGARTWHALLTAVRAEIVFRRGDVLAAAEEAQAALTLVPAEDWGVRIGLPLSTLIRAVTALGEHDRAAAVLEVPVPPAMLETGIGMLYLNARGRFLMAVGELERARAEFQACHDYSRQRGVELPNLLPWRTDLAEVHARLGAPAAARALAEEQVALARGGWAEGMALRVLGAVADPESGRPLLERSVARLHAVGARLEAAWSLAELARCHQALGDERKAVGAQRRARALGAACGLPVETGAIGPGPGIRARAVEGGTDRRAARGGAATRRHGGSGGSDKDTMSLSDAEQRVAVLAVRGLTNVQIARRLFLTVSTVEQHLTHIYKKLSIRGRAELASVTEMNTVFDVMRLPEVLP